MGTLKQKSEGGQGGRRGHSNMDHWVTTSEIKAATRGRRRREAKAIIAKEESEVIGEKKRV
jgi:hypothetical protein